MARLWDADDRAALIDLDGLAATFHAPGGASSQTVVAVLLKLGAKGVKLMDGTIVDIDDTITVSTDDLGEADMVRDAYFVVSSDNAEEAGTYRVNAVTARDQDFITVAVRRD